MTWNYRVVRHISPSGEEWYAIHEVFYQENTAFTITEDPVHPRGKTIEELNETYELMRAAFDLPPINYQDI